MTQCEAIYNAIAEHPGITGMELVTMCYTPKYTNRISEINQRYGHPIVCKKRDELFAYHGYYIREGYPKTYAELERMTIAA